MTYGQIPQPVGICTESMMNNPPLYWLFVVIRTLLRVFVTTAVASTFMIACPWELIDTSPLEF